MFACSSGCSDVVERICAYKEVNLNHVDSDGENALIIASERGCTDVVDALLRYYPHRLTSLNYQSRSYKSTALWNACANNHMHIVKRLCTIPEVDLDIPNGRIDGSFIQDYYGRTPLMIAAEHGYTDVVNYLLTFYPHRLKGVHYESKDGSTALNLACNNNHIEIVKSLCMVPSVDSILDRICIAEAIMIAVRTGYTEILQFLLRSCRHRLNVNYCASMDQITALMEACDRNHIKIVNVLVADPEIDLNVEDYDGNTVFSRAVYKRNVRVIDILLSSTQPYRFENHYSTLSFRKSPK